MFNLNVLEHQWVVTAVYFGDVYTYLVVDVHLIHLTILKCTVYTLGGKLGLTSHLGTC